MTGGGGRDRLDGGEGNDEFIGGRGDDTILGGAGRDFLLYDSEHEQGGTRGIVADVARGTVTDTFGDTDTISGIEVIVGSRFADRMTGGAGNDEFYGDAGNDTLRGGAGDDLLGGGAGNDTIDGGTGTDFVSYEFDTLLGGTRGIVANLATGRVTDAFGNRDTLTSIENLAGTALADTITGSSRGNVLFGLGGSDRIAAGSGDDTLIGGAGNDRLDGDGGVDIASFAADHLFGATTGIVADLGAGTVQDGFGGRDRLVDVEVVLGSVFADSLTGSTRADGLDGADGDDVLVGLGGDDILFGGDGNDRVNGGSGNDRIEGGAGDDRLVGGSGNDQIRGGDGDDVLAGGTSSGSGRNTLWGGTGADNFVFALGTSRNTIGDFETGPGGDRIDLSAISGIDAWEDLRANHVSVGAAGVTISDGAGLRILISGLSVSALTEDSFIF